jgi:serine/threonine protein kinase
VPVDDTIKVIDFGSATFEDGYHSNVISTRHYRAPEASDSLLARVRARGGGGVLSIRSLAALATTQSSTARQAMWSTRLVLLGWVWAEERAHRRGDTVIGVTRR